MITRQDESTCTKCFLRPAYPPGNWCANCLWVNKLKVDLNPNGWVRPVILFLLLLSLIVIACHISGCATAQMWTVEREESTDPAFPKTELFLCENMEFGKCYKIYPTETVEKKVPAKTFPGLMTPPIGPLPFDLDPDYQFLEINP